MLIFDFQTLQDDKHMNSEEQFLHACKCKVLTVWSKDHSKQSIGTKKRLKRKKDKDGIISSLLSVIYFFAKAKSNRPRGGILKIKLVLIRQSHIYHRKMMILIECVVGSASKPQLFEVPCCPKEKLFCFLFDNKICALAFFCNIKHFHGMGHFCCACCQRIYFVFYLELNFM